MNRLSGGRPDADAIVRRGWPREIGPTGSFRPLLGRLRAAAFAEGRPFFLHSAKIARGRAGVESICREVCGRALDNCKRVTPEAKSDTAVHENTDEKPARDSCQ